ncbi:hypothetical protein ACFQZC_02300 [Streptacidiphilus monticola]
MRSGRARTRGRRPRTPAAASGCPHAAVGRRGGTPLVLLVDDAQWLDLASLDLLAFVARRLDGERICLLLAAREDGVPARFDQDFPHVTAGPLERAAAVRLLDVQPVVPQGRTRAQILRQAAGNPLALVELSRAVAHGRSVPAGSDALPLTRRLERLFAADLPLLPSATRDALLLVAAAGTARLADVLRAGPASAGVEVLVPAEQAGLIRVVDGQVTFRHPGALGRARRCLVRRSPRRPPRPRRSPRRRTRAPRLAVGGRRSRP